MTGERDAGCKVTINLASQWAWWRLNSPASRSFHLMTSSWIIWNGGFVEARPHALGLLCPPMLQTLSCESVILFYWRVNFTESFATNTSVEYKIWARAYLHPVIFEKLLYNMVTAFRRNFIAQEISLHVNVCNTLGICCLNHIWTTPEAKLKTLRF